MVLLGIYFGVMGIVWVVVSVVGFVFGGVFISQVIWWWCFWINLLVFGVGFVVLVWVLKLYNFCILMCQGFVVVDWLGLFVVIGGMLMVFFGFEFGGVIYLWLLFIVICLIVFGVVMVGIFVLIEWKVVKFLLMLLCLFCW